MSKRRKSSLFERVALPAIIGILAGVLGGLGVGIISQKAASASSTTPSAH
jgi:F0F1-type ATP synthase membrane subunit c/vacuolar-type H+-ATPase subunit K